uniref:Uncharacterized protein n=1 Tax=Strigamia maritima TaxID=126957 RepID=T1JPC5_STRMM
MTISPNLSILYLNNNSLTEFDARIASLSHLAEVRLKNNPWKSNCKMSKFVVKSRLIDEKYEWFCLRENKIINLLWFLLPIIVFVILLSVIFILFNKNFLLHVFKRNVCEDSN